MQELEEIIYIVKVTQKENLYLINKLEELREIITNKIR